MVQYIQKTSQTGKLSTMSSWVNINLVDYKEINGAAKTAFSFLTESVYDLMFTLFQT